MWILVLIFLAGPHVGETYAYQAPGMPIAHRFNDIEACRHKAAQVWPKLTESLGDEAEENPFALRCVKEDGIKT